MVYFDRARSLWVRSIHIGGSHYRGVAVSSWFGCLLRYHSPDTPVNDNRKTDVNNITPARRVTQWVVGLIVVLIALCIPGGIAMAFWTTEGWWVMVSVVALIIVMAG